MSGPGPRGGGTPKGKLACLYLFSSFDSASQDSAPKLDAAVVRLGKRTALPVDNAGVAAGSDGL